MSLSVCVSLACWQSFRLNIKVAEKQQDMTQQCRFKIQPPVLHRCSQFYHIDWYKLSLWNTARTHRWRSVTPFLSWVFKPAVAQMNSWVSAVDQELFLSVSLFSRLLCAAGALPETRVQHLTNMTQPLCSDTHCQKLSLFYQSHWYASWCCGRVAQSLKQLWTETDCELSEEILHFFSLLLKEGCVSG